MPKKSKPAGVSSDKAAIIHELLGEAFETSLRQQLLTGEFNSAMLSKVLEYLKHNNIANVEEADLHLARLAAAFRADGGLNFLDSVVESTEI